MQIANFRCLQAVQRAGDGGGHRLHRGHRAGPGQVRGCAGGGHAGGPAISLSPSAAESKGFAHSRLGPNIITLTLHHILGLVYIKVLSPHSNSDPLFAFPGKDPMFYIPSFILLSNGLASYSYVMDQYEL